MIPLIEREIVNKHWMTKDEFMEMTEEEMANLPFK